MISDYDILEEENFLLFMTPEETKEKEQLLYKFASAGFNNQKIANLLNDILWVKSPTQISMTTKTYIANKYSTFDEAVTWSFRYLQGDRLTRYMKRRYLKLSMISKVIENEHVTKEAISMFLTSYSPQQAKCAYLENLALANFTDDFFARIWEVTTSEFPVQRLRIIAIKRFREKYELDETVVPDSWVARMLDEVLESAKQRMYASWVKSGFSLNGMDTVENVTRKARRV